MERWLLTSTGFDNPRLREAFLGLVDKVPKEIRVLFIPTAAQDEEAKAMLPACRADLLEAGILEAHICDYDLDRRLRDEEIEYFDAIYVCGGDPQHLANCMAKCQFAEILKRFFDLGGVYIGVSAGSMVLSQSISNGLGRLGVKLEVHKKEGSPIGKVDLQGVEAIRLTDHTGFVLIGNDAEIIE